MGLRRESRRIVKLPVRFSVDEAESRLTFTRDVSVAGAFLEGADVEPGTPVSLSISIGEQEIELVGQVVRRDDGGFAVQFQGTSNLARDVLTALVAAAFEPHLFDPTSR